MHPDGGTAPQINAWKNAPSDFLWMGDGARMHFPDVNTFWLRRFDFFAHIFLTFFFFRTQTCTQTTEQNVCKPPSLSHSTCFLSSCSYSRFWHRSHLFPTLCRFEIKLGNCSPCVFTGHAAPQRGGPPPPAACANGTSTTRSGRRRTGTAPPGACTATSAAWRSRWRTAWRPWGLARALPLDPVPPPGVCGKIGQGSACGFFFDGLTLLLETSEYCTGEGECI